MRNIFVVVCLAGCAGAEVAASARPSPAPIAVSPVASLASVAPTSSVLRTRTRPLPRDMAELRQLRDVAIAPDGERVAYVVRAATFDGAARPSAEDEKGGWKVEQQLWIAERRGGQPLQLTRGDDEVAAARFSPDGRELAFLRKVDKKVLLYTLHLGGGEARRIDLGEHRPEALEWAADGSAIVFGAARPPGDQEVEARWRRGGAVQWDREWPPIHLYSVPRAGGNVRAMSPDLESVVRFRLSPDGKRIAAVVAPSSDPYMTAHRNRLLILRADDGRVEREVEKAGQKTVIASLAWSPDGGRLAYGTTARGYSHIDELRVVAVGDSRPPVDVAAGLDLTLVGFAWAADSRSLVAAAYDRTRTALFRIPVAGGAARRLPSGDRVLFGLTGAARGRFAVASAATSRSPADPTVIDLATGRSRAVASLNPQVSQWRTAPVDLVVWKNREGIELEGLVTRTEARPGAAPPLLVMPHGGPDWVSLAAWNSWAQYFAARGYSVFQPNYRGGIGYGRAFYEANRGRLGEIEFQDIESGVDHLIAAGQADPRRLFYGSWSWGGYIGAWTLGHTKRYRAIMVGAGVVDVAVQYVTSDINHGLIAEWEFAGRPWSQPETFERANPSRFLRGASTPTLILHGEEDDRVGFVNGQILYRALTDLGVETVFWAYPREPHGFQEPAHVQHMLEVWAAFNDAHLPD